MAEMGDNIPKLDKDKAQERVNEISAKVKDNTINKWLDGVLMELSTSNPTLYNMLVDRSRKFAGGASMVQDPTSIAVSFVLEQVILLSIIDAAIGESNSLKDFTSRMNIFLKNDPDWANKLDRKLKF